jgi:pimeloyl-ACP methyl ester carboxylesterase
MRTLRVVALVAFGACHVSRTAPSEEPPARSAQPDSGESTEAAPDAGGPPPAAREIGPYELPFLPHRSVYLVVPPRAGRPERLVANLHGLCNPPGYACGYWTHAASEVGFLVCPEGNARCGPGAYEAPTWTESFEAMSQDLEQAIKTTSETYPGEITRQGAVLTGFSRGAYAAVAIAAAHPGRWPHLVLVEGDVTLSLSMLQKAGIRSVALLAGEWGSQLAGEKATCDRLAKLGFPIRLFVMPKVGHAYSADIDERMRQALAFVLAHGESE